MRMEMLTRLILGVFCCFSVANDQFRSGKGWEVDDEVVFSARVVCNIALYGISIYSFPLGLI